jgi:hypothetical protein
MNVESIVEKLKNVPVAGRTITLRNSVSCFICRRKIELVGRVLWPGAPTCARERCEVVQAGPVSEIFSTPYGPAIDSWTIRIFCSCKDGPTVFIERSALLARAQDLAQAYVDLVQWQEAYETWMMSRHPEAYKLGKTLAVPPRRIDEVRRVRLAGEWERVDPTQILPPAMRAEITAARDAGPSAPETPF